MNLPNQERCCEAEHCAKCGSVDYFNEIRDSFWATCEWNEDCLEWQGTVSANGYGVLTFLGRQWKAHRVSKALSGHFLPHWLVIDHLCKNTICVNPAHLRICTNAENVMAGDSFAPFNAKKDSCKRGHPYTKENTRLNRSRKGNGTGVWRDCRECRKIDRRVTPKS